MLQRHDNRASGPSPPSGCAQRVGRSFTNWFGEEGARVIATWSDFWDLQELDLARNAIGDAGARALASCGWLRILRKLDLFGNEIGDDGAQALMEGSTRWIKQLDLRGNRFSPATLARLQSTLGEQVLVDEADQSV